MRSDPAARQFPQGWCAALNGWAVPFEYLFVTDAAFRPGSTLRKYVYQQWLEAVQGFRELGVF